MRIGRGASWVPNSGWISFRVRSEEEVRHAVRLMRLSYLRYALKSAAAPRQLLDQQSEELHLSPRFKSLGEHSVPVKVRHVLTDPSAFRRCSAILLYLYVGAGTTSDRGMVGTDGVV